MIFVDTGAFIGRYARADQHHAEATAGWRALLAAREPLCTSDHVLDETATNLARIAGYRFAAAIARGLLTDARLRVLRAGREDEFVALDLFEKYADQKVSLTDCISFSLMRAHRVRRAFAFDRHFAAAGFEVVPG